MGEASAGASDCLVWVAQLSMLQPEHTVLLTDDDLARVGRLARQEDRARSVLAAVLARVAAARALGLPPAEVVIQRVCAHCGGPHGKPVVRGTALNLSLSHSAELVVAAVTFAGPVGVDVESMTTRLPSQLAGAVVPVASRGWSARDALVSWCRTEAVVKATGEGLLVPLSEVVVSTPDEPPRLLAYRGSVLDAQVVDLSMRPGFVGALVVLTDAALNVVFGSASTLLQLGSDGGRPWG